MKANTCDFRGIAVGREHETHPDLSIRLSAIFINIIPLVVVTIGKDFQFLQGNSDLTKRRFDQSENTALWLDGNSNQWVHLGQSAGVVEGECVVFVLPVGISVVQ